MFCALKNKIRLFTPASKQFRINIYVQLTELLQLFIPEPVSHFIDAS